MALQHLIEIDIRLNIIITRLNLQNSLIIFNVYCFISHVLYKVIMIIIVWVKL